MKTIDSEEKMMEKKIRAGIIIFGIIYIFVGWVESCILLSTTVQLIRYLGIFHWIAIFVIALIPAGSGISVLFFKKWARYLILTVSVLRLMRGLLIVFVLGLNYMRDLEFLQGKFLHWAMILPIIEICYIYFFTRLKVKEQFK